jgi:hypothetical protein
MRRILTLAAALGLIFIAIGRSMAAITFTPDAPPAGDTVAGQSAPVLYTNYAGSYPSMQIDAMLGSNDSFGFTTGYAAGNLPDSTGYPGLRLVERAVNNSGVPWTNFHVTFDNPVSIFVVTGIPETYAITGSIPNFVATVAPGLASIATTDSTVDFVFTSPIAPGGSFGMYIAFSPNDYVTGGSTHISQVPGVPEPSTIALVAIGITSLMARCIATRRR